MPQYDECSIYELACRNGTCKHNKPSKTRVVIIVSKTVWQSMSFETPEVKDSDALHQFLSLVAPGEDYTVEFRNMFPTDTVDYQYSK